MTYQSKSLVQAIDYNALVGTSSSTVSVIDPTPTKFADVAYGSDPLQTVDILVPSTYTFSSSTGVQPLGVILWIHGGGWEGGDKADESSNNSNVNLLVQSGYVVVNANYRLTLASTLDPVPNGFFPNDVNDIKKMLSFLMVDGLGQAQAPTSNDQTSWNNLRGLVKKCGLMVSGISAGGHLAVMGTFEFALDSGGLWPNAVMNFVGPMNLVSTGASDSTNPLGSTAIDIINTYVKTSSSGASNPDLIPVASPYNRRNNPTPASRPAWNTGIPNYYTNQCKFYFWYNNNDTLVPPTAILGFANALATDIPSRVFINGVTLGTKVTVGTGGDMSVGYPTIYTASHNIPNNTAVPNALIAANKLSLPITPTTTTTANTLNAIWGAGNNSYGYGQTALPFIPVNQQITAIDWQTLIKTINTTAYLQNTTIPTITQPVANSYTSRVTADQNITAALTTLYTNRLNSVAQGSSSTTESTINATWNSIATFQQDITFGTGDQARYFFNLGGQLKLTFSTPTGATINGDLSTLATACGSLYLSSGTCKIAGTQFTGVTKVGGSGTPKVLLNNFGYYSLSTSYQEIFRQEVGGSGVNATSYISVSVKSNGSQSANGDNGTVISFQTTWAQLPAGLNTVTSGTKTSVTVINPKVYSSELSNTSTYAPFTQPWASPTVAATTPTGTTITVAQPALTPLSINPNPVIIGTSTTISTTVSNAVGKTWTMTVVGPAGTKLSYTGSITSNPQVVSQDIKTDTIDVSTVTVRLNSNENVTATLTVIAKPATVYSERITMPTSNVIGNDLVIGITGGASKDTCLITGLDFGKGASAANQTVTLDDTGNGTLTLTKFGSTPPYSTALAGNLGSTFSVTFAFTTTKHTQTKSLTITQGAVPPTPTYDLRATYSEVKPGESVIFKLTTTNVPDGATFPFTISFSEPVSPSDFLTSMTLNGSTVTASVTGVFNIGKAGIPGEAILKFTTNSTSKIFATKAVGVTVTIPKGTTNPLLNGATSISNLTNTGPTITFAVDNEVTNNYLLTGTSTEYKPNLNDPVYQPSWMPDAKEVIWISKGLTTPNAWRFVLQNFTRATGAYLRAIYTNVITGEVTDVRVNSTAFSGGNATIEVSPTSTLYTSIWPGGVANPNRYMFCQLVINGTMDPSVPSEVYPYYFYGKILVGSVAGNPGLDNRYPWWTAGPYADAEWPLTFSTTNNTESPSFKALGTNDVIKIPDATVNTAMSTFTLYALGGKYSAGYTWEGNANNTFVTGINVQTSGPDKGYRQRLVTLTGTPNVAGDYSGKFTVKNNGKSLTQQYTFHVAPNEMATMKGTVITVGNTTTIVLSGGWKNDTVTIGGTFQPTVGQPIQIPSSTITLDDTGYTIFTTTAQGTTGTINYQFTFAYSGNTLSVANGKVLPITIQAGNVPPSPSYTFIASPANTTLSGGDKLTVNIKSSNVTYTTDIYFVLSGVNLGDILNPDTNAAIPLTGATTLNTNNITGVFQIATTSSATNKTLTVKWYSDPTTQNNTTLLGSISSNISWSLGSTAKNPTDINTSLTTQTTTAYLTATNADTNDTIPNGGTVPYGTRVNAKLLSAPNQTHYGTNFNIEGYTSSSGTADLGTYTQTLPGLQKFIVTLDGYAPINYSFTVSPQVETPASTGTTLPNAITLSTGAVTQGQTVNITINGTHDDIVNVNIDFDSGDGSGRQPAIVNYPVTLGKDGTFVWTSPKLNQIGVWYVSGTFGLGSPSSIDAGSVSVGSPDIGG